MRRIQGRRPRDHFRSRGLRIVGATGFGPATTYTPGGKRRRPGESIGVQPSVTSRSPARPSVQQVNPVLGGAKDSAATLLLAPEHLYTVAEVAALFRVSKATVYKLCDIGRLGCVRLVNLVRVPAGALRRFLELPRDTW